MMAQLQDILSSGSIKIFPGSVFLGPMPKVNHPKLYIIAGISGDKICVCSVIINSDINQFILKRPHLLERQLEISDEQYSFLTHKSYINCAQPHKLSAKMFSDPSYEYVGMIEDTDLEEIRNQIKASGMLTEEEINTYFS